MDVVSGEIAYLRLREALTGRRSANAFTCAEYPYDRLRLALLDPALSATDRAVRFRHALRHAEVTLGSSSVPRSLPMPNLPGWPDPERASRCGLIIRAGGETEALPWKPDWLGPSPSTGVDATVMAEGVRPWTHKYPKADFWIQRTFNHDHFRGYGQALAIRSALHMPEDETLLAVLPTGEGKSLVFQALAAASPSKVVAVVVPTVALAIAHSESLEHIEPLKPDQQHAYIGGEDAANLDILRRLQEGNQGLIFGAPEAYVGKLRAPLLDAARKGQLAAFVIDEAHLVDAWGTDFRSEFQLLGALVSELRAEAPANQKTCIVCLSATVTQQTYNTLESIFSPGRPLSLVPAARLRPEIDTWIADETRNIDERKRRVLDAVYHLPRPAILYVTTQEDAEAWYANLRLAGFERLELLHGASSTEMRKTVVERWKKGELDLVVGTSAFGLGIDFPHVRTVIHACIPESLDRYYQEVGRAGRDNRASIAVLVPDQSDREVAEAVARKKIITVEKGLRRWEAMFTTGRRDESGPARFRIDTSARVQYDPDMQGERHEDWNARVLSLMARAGVIALAGLGYDKERKKPTALIDVLRDDHREERVWNTVIEGLRKDLLTESATRLQDMFALIRSRICPSRALGTLYTLRQSGRMWPVELACGGCTQCRTERAEGWFAHWPNPPVAPWTIGTLSDRLRRLNPEGRSFVERPDNRFPSKANDRRLREGIEGLWNDGLRKCIVIGDMPDFVRDTLSNQPWCVAIGETRHILTSNGLPPGPEVVWVAEGMQLGEHDLQVRRPGEERIYLLPQGFNDPSRPERPLSDRFQLITFSFLHDTIQS